MAPWARVALVLVLAHAGVVAALAWPDPGGPVLFDLVLWALGLSGALEPSPTTSLRHRDVREAERTPLGRVLLYREGWMVRRAPVAAALLLAMSGAAAFGWLQLTAGRVGLPSTWLVVALAPAVLVGVGVVVSQVLNMLVVVVPALALWAVAVVAPLLTGEPLWTLRALALGAGAVASVYAVDLLRALRRAAEG